MIAHSLPDPFFGPAANLHGATYVLEVIFRRDELDEHGVVMDIGKAHELLQKQVKHLSYKNLDDMPEFKGKLTTTEFLARYIHDQLREDIDSSTTIKVILHESHVAYASYEG